MASELALVIIAGLLGGLVPGVVGGDYTKGGVPVAFLGKVKVKAGGKVSQGDYIMPSGKGDGLAVAVPKNNATWEQVRDAIGWALEDKGTKETAKILIAEGVK